MSIPIPVRSYRPQMKPATHWTEMRRPTPLYMARFGLNSTLKKSWPAHRMRGDSSAT